MILKKHMQTFFFTFSEYYFMSAGKYYVIMNDDSIISLLK